MTLIVLVAWGEAITDDRSDDFAKSHSDKTVLNAWPRAKDFSRHFIRGPQRDRIHQYEGGRSHP